MLRAIGFTPKPEHQLSRISTDSKNALTMAKKILSQKPFQLTDISTWVWSRPSSSGLQKKLHNLQQKLTIFKDSLTNSTLSEQAKIEMAGIAVELEQLSNLVKNSEILQVQKVAASYFRSEIESTETLINKMKQSVLFHPSLTKEGLKAYYESLIPAGTDRKNDGNIESSNKDQSDLSDLINITASLKEVMESAKESNRNEREAYESFINTENELNPASGTTLLSSASNYFRKQEDQKTLASKAATKAADHQVAINKLRPTVTKVIGAEYNQPLDENGVIYRLLKSEARNQITPKIQFFLEQIEKIEELEDRRHLWNQFQNQIKQAGISGLGLREKISAVTPQQVQEISEKVLREAYLDKLQTFLTENNLEDQDNALENLIIQSPLNDRSEILTKLKNKVAELQRTTPKKTTESSWRISFSRPQDSISEDWKSLLTKIENQPQKTQGLARLTEAFTAFEQDKKKEASPTEAAAAASNDQIMLDVLHQQLLNNLEKLYSDDRDSLSNNTHLIDTIRTSTTRTTAQKKELLHLGIQATQALINSSNKSSNQAKNQLKRSAWSRIRYSMLNRNPEEVISTINEQFSKLQPPITNWQKTIKVDIQ